MVRKGHNSRELWRIPYNDCVRWSFFVGRSQGFTDPSDRGADCQVGVLEFLFWF